MKPPTFKAVKMGNWFAVRELIPRGRYMPDGRGLDRSTVRRK